LNQAQWGADPFTEIRSQFVEAGRVTKGAGVELIPGPCVDEKFAIREEYRAAAR
jgi:hypothetical protein